MALNNKFIFASFGYAASNTLQENDVLKNSEHVLSDTHTRVFINENYKTGIPQRIVWHEHLGIVLHGIVFPKACSLDAFAENPDAVLKEILAKHQDDPQNIPYEFINGSYVGFVIDKKEHRFYAFTCFLNSIPLYYCVLGASIHVSTDFNRLAKVCNKSLGGTTNGLIEYYHLGTNLSEHTAIDGIFSVPKGAYIKFDGQNLERDYYYILPSDELNISFDDTVDALAELWDNNLKALDSETFKFGLGFTGGVDSRLILAGWPRRDKLITFTGGNPQNPDYILAHHIATKLGLVDNHFLEDYRKSDKLRGYAEILKISDNPLLLNTAQFIDQYKFRQEMGFTYEFIGLTEFLGGVYHYTSRSSIKGLIKTSLPVSRLKKISSNDEYKHTIRLGMRENLFDEILSFIDSTELKEYNACIDETMELIKVQINANDIFETFIERFRHVYKMANLLTWNKLPGRVFNELLSPSLSISVTDFAAKIPLYFRDQRKILLSYLKRYHPDLSKFVLSGSLFTPAAPWLLHKTFDPYIKTLNALGYKIPYLQWYFNKRKDQTLQHQVEFVRFQHLVCEESEFLKSTIFGQLYNDHKDHQLRRWRLFNIALLERRINLIEEDYEVFIMRNYEKAV
jgi:hypothetical protein